MMTISSILSVRPKNIFLKKGRSGMRNREHIQTTELQTFRVHGLTCANCAAKMDSSLKEVFGPQAGVNFAAASITIPAAGVRQAQAIIDCIESGVSIEAQTKGKDQQGSRKAALFLRQVLPLGFAAVLFAIGLLFRDQLEESPYGDADYLVFLTAYVLVGRNVLLSAVRNLIKGSLFDENFLMALATAGAIALGELPEAVGVMLFYSIGELLQNAAVNRSRRSIQALTDMRPDYANIKVGSETRRVEPTAVSVGEIILVRPGERVPLDGEVIEGKSFIDTSALTGESVPVRVSPGDSVLAGMVNTSGLLTVKVTRRFSESSLAKILHLVENAATRKAPTEKFITKFARYYTPAVVLAAAALAFLPPLIIPGADLGQWVQRALILLVISCPCALVVSIPLGYFGGIGGASKRGVLVKGANFLEALVDVDTVVFDKTGTLTQGVFRVSEIVPAPEFDKGTLLEVAAKAEAHSNHPIAVSICKAYGKPVDISEIAEYKEITGCGVSATTVGGQRILVGNQRLMKDQRLSLPSWDGIGTVVYVSVDGQFAGYIIISDQIKEDSAEAVAQLRKLGVRKIVMLTGDAENVANHVAAALGIDEVHSNLLPEDKVRRVEELIGQTRQRGKGKLVFVGDGINDAPVLTRADVGAAMGGLGSDAAIEAADVVIMDDMPSRLAAAISIARKTRGIVIQNIVFSLAIKGVFIALGAMGAASMWEAAFADVGVALLAILNATRALRSERSFGSTLSIKAGKLEAAG